MEMPNSSYKICIFSYNMSIVYKLYTASTNQVPPNYLAKCLAMKNRQEENYFFLGPSDIYVRK